MNKVIAYLIRVGDALSQLLNVALFFGQNPNESLSGRAYRLHKLSIFWHLLYLLINAIFFLQTNHCFKAYRGDVERAKALIRVYECQNTST